MNANNIEVNEKNAAALAEAIRGLRAEVEKLQTEVFAQKRTNIDLQRRVTEMTGELLVLKVSAMGSGPTEV